MIKELVFKQQLFAVKKEMPLLCTVYWTRQMTDIAAADTHGGSATISLLFVLFNKPIKDLAEVYTDGGFSNNQPAFVYCIERAVIMSVSEINKMQR